MTTPVPSPTPSLSLLDYDDARNFFNEQEALISGEDVSLSLLDDDCDRDAPDGNSNTETQQSSERERDGAVSVNDVPNNETSDSMDVNAESLPEAPKVAAQKEIEVITISDSSDDEDDNSDSFLESDNPSLSPSSSSSVAGVAQGNAVCGILNRTHFKRPKQSKAKLATAAFQFNSQLVHDFEVSPCFHFNFNEGGCNREPTSIHGNFLKVKLHCCFDCYEVAKAIAFHRRNDTKCPLSKLSYPSND